MSPPHPQMRPLKPAALSPTYHLEWPLFLKAVSGPFGTTCLRSLVGASYPRSSLSPSNSSLGF